MIIPDEPRRSALEDDPIVAEVRRIRGDLAARFDYDLARICEHARRRTEAAARAGWPVAAPRTRSPERTDGNADRIG